MLGILHPSKPPKSSASCWGFIGCRVGKLRFRLRVGSFTVEGWQVKFGVQGIPVVLHGYPSPKHLGCH